jgi:hypothetical protein
MTSRPAACRAAPGCGAGRSPSSGSEEKSQFAAGFSISLAKPTGIRDQGWLSRPGFQHQHPCRGSALSRLARTEPAEPAPTTMHGRRYGLSLGDGLSLARVVLTPEPLLDGRRIEEFFSRQFFSTEFWFLWSTIMGSLPQHSVIEFRRYLNRFLYLFGTFRT